VHEQKIVNSEINPHLKWTNMRDHGYLILSLTHEKASATYKFMETVKSPSHAFKAIKSMWVNSGEVKLRE